MGFPTSGLAHISNCNYMLSALQMLIGQSPATYSTTDLALRSPNKIGLGNLIKMFSQWYVLHMITYVTSTPGTTFC